LIRSPGHRGLRAVALGMIGVLAAMPAHAAGGIAELNGAALSPVWMLPFAGILLSIALVPLTAPSFWHHHFGKTAAFWALAFVIPFSASFGMELALREIVHTLLLEFLPFIILLLALFTVAGGIHVRGNLHGSPAVNTGLLASGTALASVMGTTGAAMLLIRPLLRANDNRKHRAHVVVFFIFLVANVGGGLTPLGDPPLFLGFLKGVDFFWTVKAMFLPTLTITILLLALFWLVDRFLFAQEGEERMTQFDPTPDSPVGVEGGVNFALLGGIVAAVLLSGLWNPGLQVSVYGTDLELQNVVRDGLLLAITWLSWRATPARIRHANRFEWAPIVEVAKLFAGIFLTIIPAIAIMRAGDEGVLAPLLALVTTAGGVPDNARYFWLTGVLSSVLDNAPTYLVFFNLAGGDAAVLMGPLATTLTAISAGAVFMGAMTYIGNAPNFMVKTIAESRGVKMPSFFGFLGWSTLTLGPVYALMAWLFF
jgi:Na+/H+ antiporter NhaD/arsenite permease-like protein